ncbi:MAG: NUDIX hydrolase [Oligoflexia bacterium]|nr:NUDIX hydrolase [Oligoflexia bacterium]
MAKPKIRKNSWICEKEEVLHESTILQIVRRECRSSEDDRPHPFYLLRSRDWCNIIPVTEDGKIVMVRQFRIGIDSHTLEVPGGVVDPEDQDIQAAALRELREETGYVPLPGARCVPICSPHSNPAILNNRAHSFIVGPVRKDRSQALDSGEMIDVEEVPIAELPARIARGEITHVIMLNAFLSLAFQTEEGKAALTRRLDDFRGLDAPVKL